MKYWVSRMRNINVRLYSLEGVWRCTAILFLFLATSFPVSSAEYRLGVGEVISVEVFDEPELKIENLRITESGGIRFPLIGEVVVLNKTLADIEKNIETRLLDGYLKKPKVVAKIVSYRNFYVNGQVSRPGAYPYTQGLTVRKAITIAGGMTDRAARNKIRLKKEPGYIDMLVTGMDDEVGPGEVLTVGESLF